MNAITASLSAHIIQQNTNTNLIQIRIWYKYKYKYKYINIYNTNTKWEKRRHSDCHNQLIISTLPLSPLQSQLTTGTKYFSWSKYSKYFSRSQIWAFEWQLHWHRVFESCATDGMDQQSAVALILWSCDLVVLDWLVLKAKSGCYAPVTAHEDVKSSSLN